MSGIDNPTYVNDEKSTRETASRPRSYQISQTGENRHIDNFTITESNNNDNQSREKTAPERDAWGKSIEFLMSCIAMSVGLGNVWRFPFTALEHGGGAFLIPYLIVLFFVGRPLYYMEMLLGQFSSRGSVKVYDFSPAMRGIGYGALCAVVSLSTYYSSLLGIIFLYLIKSFQSILPWSQCLEHYVEDCIDSKGNIYRNGTLTKKGDVSAYINESGIHSSSELYFVKEILKEKDTIHDGLGTPDWRLMLCLAASWILVLLILIKGVRSSGKVSYFLALFPYVVMAILLVRAVTLPGAIDGIIYFIKPQWDKILEPDVWYAAVTQAFFSLSVCFGNIIMYSSYNKFSHNVYRDANIVTSIDTLTSLLAGFTIFGILGHLAYEVGSDDVGSVVKGGTGLAFISYPDAISKFQVVPQFFSFLFFLMLFVLGLGSNVAMASCIMTIIRDAFPKVKHWQASLGIAAIGLSVGCLYVTPGGQYVLTLVDYFGASFTAFVLAVAELIAVAWIYGVDRFCKDCEFMLNRKPGLYWRLCWGFITPFFMAIILIYTIATMQPITYKGYVFPDAAYAIGWCISALGLMQLPIWAFYAIVKQDGDTIREKITNAFKPKKSWGPADPTMFDQYKKFIDNEVEPEARLRTTFVEKIKLNLFGK